MTRIINLASIWKCNEDIRNFCFILLTAPICIFNNPINDFNKCDVKGPLKEKRAVYFVSGPFNINGTLSSVNG